MRISDWSSDVCSSDLLYVDQPRTDVVLRNILRGEIDLGARLQDQALGNALVVIALDPAQNIALGREEQRAFDFEHAGSQALDADRRSEEHTSELQSLMRISYAVFCLKKKNNKINTSNVP